MIPSLLISVVTICLVTPAVAQRQEGILFPFGEGDTVLLRYIDDYATEVLIPVSLPFFGQHFSSLYVSTNGLISFGVGYSDFTPKRFPMGIPMLAVFWCDLDVRYGGNVSYRQFDRNVTNEIVFRQGDAVIQQAFGNQFNFTASWMLIATWYAVPYYSSGDYSITNTFQAVLMTDTERSFAMFNYVEINPGANRPPQIGYGDGDGVSNYSVPGSLTEEIYSIVNRTNIGTTGRMLFRIDIDEKWPVVTCPNDVISIYADVGMADAPVTWSPLPSANDTKDGVIDPASIVCENEDGNVTTSGDRFDVGSSIVTCSAYDNQRNKGSCQFSVTIIDNEAPIVVCPENSAQSTEHGTSQATVFWSSTPTATDSVDGNVTVITCIDESNHLATSGGSYRIGLTNVTCTARDSSSNQGNCSFTVAVADTEPPYIYGCPGDVIIPGLSTNQSSYTWVSPIVFDNSGQAVDVVFDCLETVSNECYECGNGTFQVGDTIVMYNATDLSGNENYCNFTITFTVVDIVCPLNVTVSADPGSATARVNWQEPYLTGWNETNFTSCAIPGENFSVGTHIVIYQQWFGINDLVLACSFDVHVVDDEPPIISGCPDDVIIPVRSTNQVPYTWVSPIFSDNSGQAIDVVFGCLATVSTECYEGGNGTFSLGDTKVMYNATDMFGNENNCDFTITVTVVAIVCPVNMIVKAVPGSTTARVNWLEPDLTGWDETNFTSSAVSGDAFPIGPQTVTYQQWFGTNNLVLTCSFNFDVVGQCASEHGHVSWPATIAGSTAESIERCPLMTVNAGLSIAVRNCSAADPPEYFKWEDHVPQSCGETVKTVTYEDIIEVPVSAGNVEEVADFLANQTSTTSSSDIDDDLELISQILENIVNAGSGDPEVADAVIETVDNVITNVKEDSTEGTSTSAIIQSVETQVSLTLQQEGMVSIQHENIHVEAVSVDPMDASNGFSFASVKQQSPGSKSPQEGTLDGTEIKTFTNTNEIPQEVIASIQLPGIIVDLLPSGNDSTKLNVSFIVYADDTLFQTALIKDSDGVKNLTLEVAGSVVSLTVEDVILVNLTEPVVINFKAPANASVEDLKTIKCVFWEFGQEDDASGFWSTEGCEVAETTNRDQVSCNCNHATNFAILVDVKGQKPTPDDVYSQALDIISQVGCALSIIALTITLAIYLSIRKLRTGKARQIFIHFCFSLLMLYIVFLAGIDNARGSGGGCVFVAALLHYLTLSTMTWMAIEARNMYVSTVKVFPEDTPRYMVKAGVIAWGSPLIVLTITLSAATEFYKNEHYCFISPGLAMYLGLLAPIGILLLHNIITFILIMRSLLKVKEASRSEQISKRLQNAVGISALMGLTWCLGFLAIEGASFTFQLLFCLANSLQGVIVCIMFCARREEVRTALAPYFRRICCGRDCQLPKRRSDRSYELSNVSQTVPSSLSSVATGIFDISVSAGPQDIQ